MEDQWVASAGAAGEGDVAGFAVCGGGVAGQDHQVAAQVEQGLATRAGQGDDLLARPPAIGHVQLVAEEDEVGVGQPVHQGVVNGKAADT